MRRLGTGLVAVGVYTTVIMAAAVAFLAATLYSSVDGHLGGYGVEVESDSRATGREDFFRDLGAFAHENGFEVAINYSSLAVSGGEYRVYSSTLPPDSERLERPRFDRGGVDVVYPLEDFPHRDPRQNIFIKGSAADEEALIRWLESQGLDVVPLKNRMVQIFASSTIPVLIILAMLLCLVLGAGHALSRSREIGIHRLLGLSLLRTVSIEAQRQKGVLLRAFIGGPLVVAGLLYAYNGWAMAGVFLGDFCLVCITLFVVLLFGYLGGQLLVRLTSIPQSIKGRIHARPILYSLLAVRCITVIAALSAVATLVGFAAEIDERHRLQEAWDQHRGPQEFALNTNTAFEEWASSDTAAPFRAADESGKLLLVDPFWLTWPIELEAPVLLVNQEYARRAGVTELNGTNVTVCSPKELSQSSMKTIEDTLDFEASYTENSAPAIEWRAPCSVGTAFTYDVELRPEVDDPILVILPLGLAPLGDHNLMSKVSQQVLLSSSAEVPEQLLKGSAGTTLSFSRPREDSWQASVRKAQHNAVLWGLNTLVAVLLVTVLVGATVMTFRIAYRRKIHVAYICGRSPWWVSKPVVTMEIAFFVATIGWLLFKLREHKQQAELRVPSTWNLGFENQWSLLTIAAVVGFGAVWLASSVLLTLRAASRWDAREGTQPQ